MDCATLVTHVFAYVDQPTHVLLLDMCYICIWTVGGIWGPMWLGWDVILINTNTNHAFCKQMVNRLIASHIVNLTYH